MSEKSKIAIIGIVLCIISLCTACASPVSQERQELSNLLISRCSKTWHDLGLADDTDYVPDNLHWTYMQYDDRQALIESAGIENYYGWLPESGYVVGIGSVFSLYGNDNNIIGYYADEDHFNFIASTIQGSDSLSRSEHKLEELMFQKIMLIVQFYAKLDVVSFDDYDTKQEKTFSFCALTDEQISKIH